MRIILCGLVSSFVLFGCNKKPNYTLEATEIPASYEIDINQDGVIDFVADYTQLSTSDIPVSGSSVIGSLTPSENVYALYEVYNNCLFLQANDVIDTTSTSVKTWSFSPADIVTKNWSDDTGWETNWTVNSSQNDYYLAFKLQNGAVDELGWLKLEFDLNTGEITIIDQAITSANSIVI